MVKAIIFDLWGTLIEHGVNPSPSKQARYFLRVRAPFSEFITTFEDSFMSKDFPSLKDGFDQVVKDFNLRIPDFVFEKMIGMWNKNSILSEMYPEVEETLKDLKSRGIKLYLLANIDRFSYEQVSSKFGFDQYFDKVYPSYSTGLLKMNPEAYLKIIKDNKLKAEDVIVVGDCVVSDMNSAKKAGLKGVLLDRKQTREYEDKIVSLEDLKNIV